MTIKTVSLTREDIKKLQTKNKAAYIMLPVLLILFAYLCYALYHLFLMDNIDWLHNLVELVAFPIIALMIANLYISIKDAQKDIFSSEKERITGVLTEPIIINTNRSSTFSPEYDIIFILKNINEQEHKISQTMTMSDYEEYVRDKTEIRQTIVLERSLYSKTFLKINILS